MTGNTFFDACRMFKHACAFVDCATFCEKEPKNIKTGVMTHTVADIVNSAFACEVFIKSLLIYRGLSIDEIHDHRLKLLWSKYRNIDSANATLLERRMKEFFCSENEDMFNELLDNISDAFSYWRYIYEKHGGKIHIQFLRVFREMLREVCCETYYQMTWNDYLNRE